ncbi:MAG: ATP-binding protein [Planctomycetota bacterium]
MSAGSTPHLEPTAGPAPAIDLDDLARLRESFQVFSERTEHLERAYERLTRRATRVDLELRRANVALGAKVAELEALSESRRRLLSALPNGVVVVDAAGSLACVNPAAARLLGRPAEELEGRLRDAAVGPTGDALLVTGDDAGRGRGRLEREVVAHDGSRRRVAIDVVDLGEGSEMQVLTDLTVVTRLREQVGRLDTLATLGEMAASIAHEIRNPLNGIDGFAGLLQRRLADSADEDVRRYAERVRTGVRELDAIVVNLLAFAAPEELRAERFDLRPLVHEIAETAVAFAGGDHEVDVLVSFPGGTSATLIEADPIKLRMILRNLVKNGVEALGTGGTLRVGFTRDEGSWTLTVDDDGEGVPAAMRERLFRPFSTSKARGTGLGLAIARKLAGLHGGTLRYEPLEPGSRFALTVPTTAGDDA